MRAVPLLLAQVIHELYMNDGALERTGLTREVVETHSRSITHAGTSLKVEKPWRPGGSILIFLNRHDVSHSERLKEVNHHGGHTMIAICWHLQLGDGVACDVDQLKGDDVPFRTECIARGAPLGPMSYHQNFQRERAFGRYFRLGFENGLSCSVMGHSFPNWPR